MALPEPESGLVFRYDYLWSDEAKRGRTTSKDRPACVALATHAEEGPRRVVILPITHTKPTGDTAGIEIPSLVRQALGLDDQQCWVIISEHNVDDWPNAGIMPLPGSKGTFAHGILPPRLFDKIRVEFLKRYSRSPRVRR